MLFRSAHFPDDENGEVLRRMHESGDDLSKPRNIDFTVVLPSKEAAQAVGDHFHKLGYEVSAERTGTVPDLPWDLVVVRHMKPEHSEITKFEEALAVLAKEHGGRNDGWGCYEQ
jgi:regulator of RNase E activity RraB